MLIIAIIIIIIIIMALQSALQLLLWCGLTQSLELPITTDVKKYIV